MKTKTITGLLILLMFITSLTLSAQKPDFSGEWKLNREKTALTDNSLFLAGITIKIKADSLFTSRLYENSNGEQYPFDENVSLDGKEAKITIYDMPRVTKATGEILLKTVEEIENFASSLKESLAVRLTRF